MCRRGGKKKNEAERVCLVYQLSKEECNELNLELELTSAQAGMAQQKSRRWRSLKHNRSRSEVHTEKTADAHNMHFSLSNFHFDE